MQKKRQSKRRFFKKRPCRFCKEKLDSVEYTDTATLEKFISERGRIISSSISGNCAKHQRMVANAIKKARLAALLPFVRVKQRGLRRGRRTR